MLKLIVSFGSTSFLLLPRNRTKVLFMCSIFLSFLLFLSEWEWKEHKRGESVKFQRNTPDIL